MMSKKRAPLSFPKQYPLIGEEWVPFYCVVQWIVTKGDTNRDRSTNDRAIWFGPIRELMKAAELGHIQVRGRQLDRTVEIDAIEFAGCGIAYPFEEIPDALLKGTATYLRLVDYDFPGEVPDDFDGRDPHYNLEWHDDLNDGLWRGAEPVYSHLLVPAKQALALWSSATWDLDFDWKPVLIAEMERRYAALEGEFFIKSGSKDLQKWFAEKYPGQKVPSVETIRKHIRPMHQQLRGVHRSPK